MEKFQSWISSLIGFFRKATHFLWALLGGFVFILGAALLVTIILGLDGFLQTGPSWLLGVGFKHDPLALVGLIGAVTGIPLLIWHAMVGQKQANVAQQQADIARKRVDIAQQGQITYRFHKAVEGLGAFRNKGSGNGLEPILEVRLGAIYALEQIAKETPNFYIQVMEILCAYIRTNAPVDDKEAGRDTENSENVKPREDIQIALTVLGRRDKKAIEGIEAKNDYYLNLSKVNIMEADLSEADFRGAKLYKADLRGAILFEADFRGAILFEADLRGAILFAADLSGAILDKATLSKAYLRGANLVDANLVEANLKGANLFESSLAGANLSKANLKDAKLREADLRGAELKGANLDKANLIEANLSGANLSGADLIGAELIGANLSGVNLFEADLIEANLVDANLGGANLGGANLGGADLGQANLVEANLFEASLAKANLSGANLFEANLRGANFSEAIFSDVKNLNTGGLRRAWAYADTPPKGLAEGSDIQFCDREKSGKPIDDRLPKPFIPPETPPEGWEAVDDLEMVGLFRKTSEED